MNYRACTVALGLLMLIGPPAVRAGFVTVTITGKLDTVDPALAGTFSVGQMLTSTYKFNSATPPRAGSNSTFAVFDALQSLTFTIGGYTASSTGAPEIQVDNNPGMGNHDRYAVVARASDGLMGPPVAGKPLSSFSFRLDDSTDTVFTNALILPTSLSLSSFDSNRFFVFFVDGPDLRIASGTLTTLDSSSVPEPSGAALMVLGLAGVSVAGRLRRRFGAA